MRKILFLLSTVVALLLFSCSKSLEDRLIGNWQLEDAWKRVFLGRDHFQTGYESGIFTFLKNGMPAIPAIQIHSQASGELIAIEQLLQ